MTATLPKKALDLLELGRAHGWTVETQPLDPIAGLDEAHGLGFLRTLDDGRELFFLVAYGRRTELGTWVLLHDPDGHVVTAEIIEPTLDTVPMFGPDLRRYWTAVRALRHWLARPDELVELWRSEGDLPERRTLRDRLTP